MLIFFWWKLTFVYLLLLLWKINYSTEYAEHFIKATGLKKKKELFEPWLGVFIWESVTTHTGTSCCPTWHAQIKAHSGNNWTKTQWSTNHFVEHKRKKGFCFTLKAGEKKVCLIVHAASCSLILAIAPKKPLFFHLAEFWMVQWKVSFTKKYYIKSGRRVESSLCPIKRQKNREKLQCVLHGMEFFSKTQLKLLSNSTEAILFIIS